MDLKKLYQIAKQELISLYDEDATDLRLEQVTRSENGDNWEVVVSYLLENKNQPTKIELLDMRRVFPYERVYKLLKINSNGEVEELLMFNRAS